MSQVRQIQVPHGESVLPLHFATLVEFRLSKALKLRIRRFMYAAWETVLRLKRGPNQRRSGQRTVGQGTTSRCVWITRSSKVSRFARPWGAARVRWRDTYLLNSVRELRQCALLGANPKVIYSGRVFPSLALLWHAGSAEEEAIYLGALKQGLVGLGYIELVDPVDLLPGRRCVASRCRYLLLFNGAGGVLRSTLSGGAVWLR
jgi:hypothetical protein